VADTGVNPEAEVPPYEGRKDKTGAGAEADDKAFRADEHAPPPSEGREVSEEERGGVESTDTTGASPHGVGESTTESGEELAARDSEDRAETGVHGKSERPYGSPAQTDSVGVQDNVDEDSPPTQRT
jgi:hypothetical protein